jgi:polyhydroxyalkanoate synthesis regulator phasin
VGDEADNVVLRLLREMRAEMATKRELAEIKGDLSDLRHDVSEGFARTTAALTTIARRMDADDAANRLSALEKRVAELERRVGQ